MLFFFKKVDFEKKQKQNYPEAKLTLYCWAMKILICYQPHLEVQMI